MDEDILAKAMKLFPIGGTYEIDQRVAYRGYGSIHSFSPTHKNDYVYYGGNMNICGIGVYKLKNNIWPTNLLKPKEIIYEIY